METPDDLDRPGRVWLDVVVVAAAVVALVVMVAWLNVPRPPSDEYRPVVVDVVVSV